MPASNPRLNVTVTPHQHQLLMELGELQGRSAASFLREMLDAAMPMLDAMLPIYRSAAQQAAMQPEALQLAIRDALAGVEAQRAQLDLLGLIADTTPNTSNDDGAQLAPSGAREEKAPSRRNRRQ